MQTPSQDSIKASEGRFHVIRTTVFAPNRKNSERTVWRVAERLQPNLWALRGEFNNRTDAFYRMFVLAGV